MDTLNINENEMKQPGIILCERLTILGAMCFLKGLCIAYVKKS